MNPLKVQWNPDPQANGHLWREMDDAVLRLDANTPGIERIADLGGGSGWFANQLRRRISDLVTVCVDVVPCGGGSGLEQVRYVVGSILDLPLRDASFDAATARASLHHVPDELDRALVETARILRPGGICLIQEPLSGNPVAALARRFVLTDIHEEGERALDRRLLLAAIDRHFLIREVRYHFVFTYLLPHLISRLPASLKPAGRALTRILFAVDRWILKIPDLQGLAAYVFVKAERRPAH